MSDYMNLCITFIFLVLAIMMGMRMYQMRGKISIPDQQWSSMRIIFLVFGLLSILTLIFNQTNTMYDYGRGVATAAAVILYLLNHDGIGKEGLITAGHLYSWKEIKSWDTEDRKNTLAVYFQVNGQNDKKTGAPIMTELFFAKKDKEAVKEILDQNLSRKYTRMKRK